MLKIYIEAKDVFINNNPYKHLYLVYRNNNGEEYVIRGGPYISPAVDPITLEFGILLDNSLDSRNTRNDKGEIIKTETPMERGIRVLNLNGRNADDVWNIMLQKANSIRMANLNYELTSQNSNSVIASCLNSVGIDVLKNLPFNVPSYQLWKAPGITNTLPQVASTLVGSNSADIIKGGNNNDKIYGKGGNDKIYSGLGEDYIDTGSGNNKVYLEGGRNYINSGSGKNKFYFDTTNMATYRGENTIDGINANDEIYINGRRLSGVMQPVINKRDNLPEKGQWEISGANVRMTFTGEQKEGAVGDLWLYPANCGNKRIRVKGFRMSEQENFMGLRGALGKIEKVGKEIDGMGYSVIGNNIYRIKNDAGVCKLTYINSSGVNRCNTKYIDYTEDAMYLGIKFINKGYLNYEVATIRYCDNYFVHHKKLSYRVVNSDVSDLSCGKYGYNCRNNRYFDISNTQKSNYTCSHLRKGGKYYSSRPAGLTETYNTINLKYGYKISYNTEKSRWELLDNQNQFSSYSTPHNSCSNSSSRFSPSSFSRNGNSISYSLPQITAYRRFLNGEELKEENFRQDLDRRILTDGEDEKDINDGENIYFDGELQLGNFKPADNRVIFDGEVESLPPMPENKEIYEARVSINPADAGTVKANCSLKQDCDFEETYNQGGSVYNNTSGQWKVQGNAQHVNEFTKEVVINPNENYDGEMKITGQIFQGENGDLIFNDEIAEKYTRPSHTQQNVTTRGRANNSLEAGLIAGGGAVLALIFGGLVCLWCKRRKKKKQVANIEFQPPKNNKIKTGRNESNNEEQNQIRTSAELKQQNIIIKNQKKTEAELKGAEEQDKKSFGLDTKKIHVHHKDTTKIIEDNPINKNKNKLSPIGRFNI